MPKLPNPNPPLGDGQPPVKRAKIAINNNDDTSSTREAYFDKVVSMLNKPLEIFEHVKKYFSDSEDSVTTKVVKVALACGAVQAKTLHCPVMFSQFEKLRVFYHQNVRTTLCENVSNASSANTGDKTLKELAIQEDFKDEHKEGMEKEIKHFYEICVTANKAEQKDCLTRALSLLSSKGFSKPRFYQKKLATSPDDICPSCLSKFDTRYKVPVLFDCCENQYLCQTCVHGLYKSGNWRCSNCRSPIALTCDKFIRSNQKELMELAQQKMGPADYEEDEIEGDEQLSLLAYYKKHNYIYSENYCNGHRKIYDPLDINFCKTVERGWNLVNLTDKFSSDWDDEEPPCDWDEKFSSELQPKLKSFAKKLLGHNGACGLASSCVIYVGVDYFLGLLTEDSVKNRASDTAEKFDFERWRSEFAYDLMDEMYDILHEDGLTNAIVNAFIHANYDDFDFDDGRDPEFAVAAREAGTIIVTGDCDVETKVSEAVNKSLPSFMEATSDVESKISRIGSKPNGFFERAFSVMAKHIIQRLIEHDNIEKGRAEYGESQFHHFGRTEYVFRSHPREEKSWNAAAIYRHDLFFALLADSNWMGLMREIR